MSGHLCCAALSMGLARLTSPTLQACSHSGRAGSGGKGKLLNELLSHVPASMGTYIEPFCGGAAVFFALAGHTPRPFERAILCDQNEDLMACYRALRDDLPGLVRALRKYRYDRELFYETRAKDPSNLKDAARGARFLFLNKTCFNGLWRVNSKGQFNVPFGTYKNPIMGLGEAGLVAAIVFHAFNGLRIIAIDFWKKGPKYQRQLLWGVLALWAVTMIPFLIRHLTIVFSNFFGGH